MSIFRSRLCLRKVERKGGQIEEGNEGEDGVGECDGKYFGRNFNKQRILIEFQ